jgi:hypothetical protein
VLKRWVGGADDPSPARDGAGRGKLRKGQSRIMPQADLRRARPHQRPPGKTGTGEPPASTPYLTRHFRPRPTPRRGYFHSSPSGPFTGTNQTGRVSFEQTSGEGCSTNVPRLFMRSGAFSFLGIIPCPPTQQLEFASHFAPYCSIWAMNPVVG